MGYKSVNSNINLNERSRSMSNISNNDNQPINSNEIQLNREESSNSLGASGEAQSQGQVKPKIERKNSSLKDNLPKINLQVSFRIIQIPAMLSPGEVSNLSSNNEPNIDIYVQTIISPSVQNRTNNPTDTSQQNTSNIQSTTINANNQTSDQSQNNIGSTQSNSNINPNVNGNSNTFINNLGMFPSTLQLLLQSQLNEANLGRSSQNPNSSLNQQGNQYDSRSQHTQTETRAGNNTRNAQNDILSYLASK